MIGKRGSADYLLVMVGSFGFCLGIVVDRLVFFCVGDLFWYMCYGWPVCVGELVGVVEK